MNYYNKHYIRIDGNENITHGFSDAFEQPLDSDICINEQGGYQFRLEANGPENPQLRNEHGVCFYKYLGEQVVAKSSEDIAAETPAPAPAAPTLETRLSAAEDALLALLMGGGING